MSSRKMLSFVFRTLQSSPRKWMTRHDRYYTHTQSRCMSTPSKWHGLWEPNDLKLEPDVPEYETINIQMKGYDYPILESYAKFVHNVMDKRIEIDNDAWPMPSKSTQVRLFHPRSSVVSEKYDIQEFERIVSIDNVPSTNVPLILQILQKNIPEGVKVTLREPSEEEDSERYVPDYDILELRAQKEFIESGKLGKKNKKKF